MTEVTTHKYEKNFLKNVVFRIDFSPILKLTEEVPVDFQESLRERFPILEQQQAVTFKSTFKGKEKVDEKSEFRVWFFFDKEKQKKLTITYNWLAVEFFQYRHFEEFQELVQYVYDRFSQVYRPINCSRLGLRYVNRIEFPEGHPLEWSQFLASSICCSIESFWGKQDLSRAMTQFTLNRGDHTILFNFGVANSEFPARISRKEFILDYDCNTRECEDAEPLAKLDEFHLEIEGMFKESITKELEKLMGVKE